MLEGGGCVSVIWLLWESVEECEVCETSGCV